ncbi:MAG: restriction endonuclease subunit S [Clostridia bacterium]|nr:restriction endonuclease subunit S [Clostridia bacterium]
MTAQELKNSILQLAMQGKLVAQDNNDEPVFKLLKRIESEKTRLVKEGKIKPEKKLLPITEEEIPFDAPESWKWLKLGYLCQLREGEKISNKSYPYLEAKYLRGKIEATFLTSGEFVKKGTRLILVDGENSGEVFLATEDGYKGSTFKVLYIPEEMYVPYVLMFILLNKQLLRKRKRGSAIPHLNKELFFNLLIPIPPFAEQRRIVDKIEELLPLVEEYEKVESNLKTLNSDFTNMLRKSILQQAVQGKLTERMPEDTPVSVLIKQLEKEKAFLIKNGKIKKEKPLPPITEEEILFDIPDTWSWVRLTDIGEVSRGKSKHRPRNDKLLYDGGTYPLIQTGDVARSNGIIKKCSAYYNDFGLAQSRMWKKGTLCMTIAANIADVGILDFDACFPDSVVGFNAFNPITSNKYFLYMLMAYQNILDGLATKSAQKNINLEIISSLAYPLPPLEEQERIVERVEELLSLCDQLK